MRCPRCGQEVPPGSRFCQYCGGDLSGVRFCPSCGFQLRDGVNFCAQCGQGLQAAAPAWPEEPQDTVPFREEPVRPTGAETAVMTPGAVPAEPLEKQRVPEFFSEYPGNAQNGLPVKTGQNAREAVSRLGETAEGERTGEASPAGGIPRKRKRQGWILPALLCVIAMMAAGVFLWSQNAGGSSGQADISEIADFVLYLEVFDKDDEWIGSASGFLVNDQSTLVTNYHVAQDAYHIVAKTADGAQSTDVSSILAYDEVADLAILSCDAKANVEPLTLGDSETVRQGDKVYAVGYPLGLANTLSDGIVSSRYIDEYDNDILQVTAAISEGNSGGPLLDANGRVIGIMCAYYVYGQNLNIAIASNTLADLLESGFHQAGLMEWEDRPEMPGYELDEEEQTPEDTAGGGPDVIEEAPGHEPDVDPDMEQPGVEQPKTGEEAKTPESKPAAPAEPENTGASETPADPNTPSYGTGTSLPDTAVPLTSESVTGVWKSNVYNDDDWDYEYFLTFSENRFQRLYYNYIYEEYSAYDSNLELVDDGAFYIDGSNIVVTYRTLSLWDGTVSDWKSEIWPVEYIHPGGIRFQNGVLGYVSYYYYSDVDSFF